MLIGIIGNMGAGKDTMADMLVSRHGFKKVAFAGALKSIAVDLMDLNHDDVYGPSERRNALLPSGDDYWQRVQDRILDDEWIARVAKLFDGKASKPPSDALWDLIEGFSEMPEGTCTVRHVLQQLGTEWGRVLWPDVWLHGVKLVVDEYPLQSWVVTDTRFLNEAKYIRDELHGYPVWVDASYRCRYEPKSKHASEPELSQFESLSPAIIDNNGTIADLEVRVASLLRRLKQLSP